MEIIDPGHKYKLDSYDGGEPQTLTFMKRIGDGYPGNQGEPYSGTNCQEVIRGLIDRTEYLNRQVHSIHNESIIQKLKDTLWLFEDRAALRHNIDQFDFRPEDIHLEPACITCGHVICEGHEEKTK